MYPSALLLLLVVLAGLLGGSCSAFYEVISLPSTTRIRIALRILESVIAAAVVPLFLSLIGNNEIGTLLSGDSSFDPKVQYIALKTFGFCLIAAISARRFLDTVSSRVFALERELKDAEKRIEKTEQKVDIINTAVNEPDESSSPLPEEVVVSGPLTEIDSKVLASLSGGLPLRSISGIARSTGAAPEEVDTSLTRLSDSGLATKIITDRGKRWMPTLAGRELATDVNLGPSSAPKSKG